MKIKTAPYTLALPFDFSKTMFIAILLAHLFGWMTITQAQTGPEEAGAEALEPMTVTGEAYGETRYTVPDAITATKTDTPIMETPSSINVITRENLDDRQVFQIGEVFDYTSGVSGQTGSGRSPFSNALIIRGFSNRENGGLGAFYYRDGFRMAGIPLSIANLDRLELLKGPATVLYGQAEPGGLVNAVYKRPQSTPYYSLEQRFGSYDFYQTNVDATGPLTEDDTLLYRFNLSYIDEGSFREFLENNLLSVAPSLTWNINDRAQLTAQFEYSKTEWNFPVGIPAIGDRPAPIPSSRTLVIDPVGRPDWEQENYVTNLDFSYQINDAWKLRWVGLYARQNLQGNLPIFIGDLNERTGQVSSGFQVAEPEGVDRQWWFTTLNVIGNMTMLDMGHQWLFGFDYNHEDSDLPVIFQDFDIDFNIFDPNNFQGRRLTTAELLTSGFVDEFFQINRRLGVYIQDQIAINDQLRLVLGGRFDYTQFAFDLPGADIKSSTDLNPRAGILYQPWSWLSTYYQYVESFGGFSSGREADGSAFSLPQTGKQHEFGIKTQFFDGRLTSTLAFYHLTKSNLATPDPVNPLFSRPVGAARSQGIELDVIGAITDRVNVSASYSFTDTKITKSNDGTEGNRLPNVPRNMGNLWVTYDLMENFKFGAGVIAMGQRQGDNENSFQLPGYARVDAMAAYRVKLMGSMFTAQLNINNLLNKDYFAYSQGGRISGAFPGDPLTVIGSVRLEY